MAEQIREILGVRLRFLREGSGPPLVLLHGWGCTCETVAVLTAELARCHSVIAIDLPGHGKSSLPPPSWGSEEFAACVTQLLLSLSLSRVQLVGHSVGGRLGVIISATQPGLVEKLALCGASGIRLRRPLKYYLKVTLAKSGKFAARYLGARGQRLKEAVYNRVASPDYQNAGALRQNFLRIVNEDIRHLLPKVQIPTLLLWGAEDREVPVGSAIIMHRLLPHSELAVIDNAGHYAWLDQPVAFIARLRRFLEEKQDGA